MKKPITFSELLEILEQFPEEISDVYCQDRDEVPVQSHLYTPDPPHSETILIRVPKREYEHRLDAAKRAEYLFEVRGVVPYKYFYTPTYHVWYTTKKKK